MGPTILAAAIRRIKPSMLLVAAGRGFDQGKRALFVFLTKIKPTVGIKDGSLPQFFLLLPLGLAALQILASPAFAIGVTVDIAAQLDDSSMVIHHHLVGVELLANFNDRSKRALTQLLRKRQSLEAASGDWLTMKSHI